MVFFPLFAGCASEYFAPASAETLSLADESGPTARDAATAAARQAGHHVPLTLSITVPPDTAGFVEVRPYRVDAAGEVEWTGRAIVEEAIMGTPFSVTLPPAAPYADRTADSNQAVVYAVALRAEDADGEPGIYTGLAQARLVWYQHTAPVGANPGWNLALNLGKSDETWLGWKDGLTFDENLVAPDTFELGGHSAVDVVPGTHVQLATADGVAAFDQPLFPDWTLALDAAPPLSALSDRLDYEGAELTLQAYDDDDGDNVRTEEAIVGEACLGTAPAVVTWTAYAYDLPDALILAGMNRRAGWDLMRQFPEGLVSEPIESRTGLIFSASCE